MEPKFGGGEAYLHLIRRGQSYGDGMHTAAMGPPLPENPPTVHQGCHKAVLKACENTGAPEESARTQTLKYPRYTGATGPRPPEQEGFKAVALKLACVSGRPPEAGKNAAFLGGQLWGGAWLLALLMSPPVVLVHRVSKERTG